MDQLGISSTRRHRSQRQRVGVMVKISRAAEAQRYRPVADAAFLDQLARRFADTCLLPLRVAKARVEQMSISAGAARDAGGDARWWKARSKPGKAARSPQDQEASEQRGNERLR